MQSMPPPAREHFTRLIAAEEADEPFRATSPTGWQRTGEEWRPTREAVQAELDAARADAAPYLCQKCGGTGRIDTREELEFAAAVSRIVGVDYETATSVTYGACYGCERGWSRPDGVAYARAHGLLSGPE